jgi:hypothetical protein
LEQFTDETLSRWKSSTAKKIIDGVEDDLLLQYRGGWGFEEPFKFPAFVGDKGLVAKTAAAHHVRNHSFFLKSFMFLILTSSLYIIGNLCRISLGV